ncbi:MAG: hypothetical protein JWL83_1765, partial [Actinomycetia bacterium]|nr:hypothetical protein [Actinomycetes bacterium]
MPGQVQRATTRAAHRRTRTSVTTRLVALGLLPVSAMGLVVGRLTIEYRARAAEAAEVERTVPRVDRLLALREAVHVELTAVGITARAVQFGLQPGEMATTLGLPQSRVSRGYTRAATDNAIRVLGSASPIDARALRALRTRIDAGALNPADATYAFVEFDRKVDGVGTPLFRTLQRKTQAMVDGTQLSDDLSTLQ